MLITQCKVLSAQCIVSFALWSMLLISGLGLGTWDLEFGTWSRQETPNPCLTACFAQVNSRQAGGV